MGAKKAERIARISDLSVSHQKNIHQIDMVNRDEEVRRLKLRLLSLRDENASLKDQLSQKDSRIALVCRKEDDSRAELSESREKLKLQDVKLKKQNNELMALKTELESLNGSVEDSSKALQEKFALNRELTRIRPEMEHLKSQLANHQSVIAEKHDLQRQLNTLEVELENEKRSKDRLRQKLDTDTGDELKTRLAESEKQIESQRKDWEKAKKKYEGDLREAEGEREQLDERVSTMRLKLKSVQTELKETRDELAKCRSELELARKVPWAANALPKKAAAMKDQTSRKRRIHDISMEDISIGTPGPDEATLKRPLKKRAAEYALVGEKSTFSVTPFLSKTKNISDDSIDAMSPSGKHAPVSELAVDEGEVEEEETQSLNPSPQPSEKPAEVTANTEKPHKPKSQKSRGRPRKALNDASTLKKNMPSTTAKRIKEFQVNTKLDLVEEEAEISEQDNGVAKKHKSTFQLKAKGTESKPGNPSMEAETRKKKRKILGSGNKTLFDDEDGETIPKQPKVQLGVGRKLKAPLGGVSNAFGGKTFSPLKRDRRGVGASFLV